MSGIDALQSVQFVTVKGQRLAVMNAEDWEIFVEWIETIADVAAANDAYKHLIAAGGDRTKAGWLKWSEVADTLE